MAEVRNRRYSYRYARLWIWLKKWRWRLGKMHHWGCQTTR